MELIKRGWLLHAAASMIFACNIVADQNKNLYPVLTVRAQAGYATNGESPAALTNAVAWHPTRAIFAVGGGPRDSASEVELYSFTGAGTGGILTQLYGGIRIGSSFVAKSLAWSPDGTLLAVSGTAPSSGYEVQVYQFNSDNSFTQLVTSDFGVDGSTVSSIAWSPNGKYIAVGGYSQKKGYQVLVYFLDSFTPALYAVAGIKYGGTSAQVNSVAWSPSGNYLAIGGNQSTAGTQVQVYSWSDSSYIFTLTKVADANYAGSAGYVSSVAWEPSGVYLSAGGYNPTNGNEVQLFSFSNNQLTLLSSAQVDFGDTTQGSYADLVLWHPSKPYFAIGGYAQFNSKNLIMYAWSAANATLTPMNGTQLQYGNTDSYISSASWNSNGQYLAVVGVDPKNSKPIRVYELRTV